MDCRSLQEISADTGDDDDESIVSPLRARDAIIIFVVSNVVIITFS